MYFIWPGNAYWHHAKANCESMLGRLLDKVNETNEHIYMLSQKIPGKFRIGENLPPPPPGQFRKPSLCYMLGAIIKTVNFAQTRT